MTPFERAHWLRHVAEAMRAHADSLTDPICARIWHGVADDYDQAADRAAEDADLSVAMQHEISVQARMSARSRMLDQEIDN